MPTSHPDLFADIDLAARLPDGANVLLEAPSFGSTADAACIDLLTVTPPSDTRVVSITLTQTPDDRLAVWQTYASEQLPAALDIISAGDASRSTALREASTHQPASTLTVEPVFAPGDLTGLGIEFTDAVQRWQRDTADTSMTGCFHSVTTLLQYADLRRAFRFLHALTARVGTTDAVMHYHLAADAHDQRTRSTLHPLFDLVVTVDADGAVDIRE